MSVHLTDALDLFISPGLGDEKKQQQSWPTDASQVQKISEDKSRNQSEKLIVVAVVVGVDVRQVPSPRRAYHK